MLTVLLFPDDVMLHAEVVIAFLSRRPVGDLHLDIAVLGNSFVADRLALCVVRHVPRLVAS